MLEGEPVEFSIDADSTKILSQIFNVGVVEKNGVIAPEISLRSSPSGMSYEARMTTSATLAVGTHASSIELRLCEDDPLVCRTPVAGSPWLIPIKITVKPANMTPPLRHITALANWSTARGNAAHNAYVPAAFDPLNFSRRWVLEDVKEESVAHDNGLVILAKLGPRVSGAVRAISEETGTEVWRKDHTYTHLYPAAVANGRIYYLEGSPTAWLRTLDQAGVNLSGFAIHGAAGQQNEAPIVHGNGVYVEAGYDSLMARYDAATGTLAWRADGIPHDTKTPAASGDHLYVYGQKTLYKVRASDGKVAASIRNDGVVSDRGMAENVVLSGTGRMAFVVEDGTLFAFDVTRDTLAWRSTGKVAGLPAVANDMLYIFGWDGTTVDARDVATGTVQWTASRPSPGASSTLLVTNNLVFVSGANSTWAIDLTTHKKVWEYPLGGELSLSNRGILYIAGGGKLVAFNLH
ncbi:hypothetical protein GCM10007387_27280 [Pseudoduganella albidiflava]|uniref:Pyrrolo-quinoline quinone repeat domain-containing protein n=1 Tax=Pseudoduganella albidiflava TaxID=321983 RepID=A0AA87XXF1_9BURK|nr:hypothetical protein GCM10007387_27280 [Pseudoduganella albidiflava]